MRKKHPSPAQLENDAHWSKPSVPQSLEAKREAWPKQSRCSTETAVQANGGRTPNLIPRPI